MRHWCPLVLALLPNLAFGYAPEPRFVPQFDAENQLPNISVPGQWQSRFVYDGLGRKRIERDFTWTGGGWQQTNEVRLVYDGMLVLQERGSNNSAQVTYTRGLDLSGSRQGAGGIGGLLARSDHSAFSLQHSYFHFDGAGNVTALMDAQQHIVARYLYDPFGRQLGQWGELAAANRYRFSSKEVHPQSGLHYYGFRHYDPSLQRWLTEDPLGEGGGLNLYRFVLSNPLRYVDPDGLAPQLIGVKHDPYTGVSLGMYGPDLPEPGPVRGGGSLIPPADTVEGAWVRGFYEGFMESLFGRSDHDMTYGVLELGPLSLSGAKAPKICPPRAKVTPRPSPPYWERPPQYYISDGVRRSLAARESGTPTIRARLTRLGQADELVDVHLDQLHSPKPSIDLTDPRFSPKLRLNYPPIEIQPLGLPGQAPSFHLLSVEIY